MDVLAAPKDRRVSQGTLLFIVMRRLRDLAVVGLTLSFVFRKPQLGCLQCIQTAGLNLIFRLAWLTLPGRVVLVIISAIDEKGGSFLRFHDLLMVSASPCGDLQVQLR